MLHVVGNLCRDTTLTVDRFPEPGETLVARDSRSGWGGKGLNQAVAATRAGAPVTLYAAVGFDDLPAILADLDGEAWPVLRLTPVQQPTDMSVVLVRGDGENLIVSATGCARGFDPLEADGQLIFATGDALLMQGNLPRKATMACLSDAKQQGARTLLNPSPLWDDAVDWRLVDVIILNAGELIRITGRMDVAAGARWLRDAGVGIVVVTLGAEGAMAFYGLRSIAMPAPLVAPRDTSGAGDVFCGVLVAGLHRGEDLEKHLRMGVAAAALSVTRPGALASCPTADEIARLTTSQSPGSFT